MEAIETIEHNNKTIEIYHDENSESPRNWDNLGSLYCLHKRYSLGDKHNYDVEDLNAIAQNKNNITLNVYAYEHGGIVLNTSGFSCPWDSGQVGIITVSLDKVRKEYNVKRVSKRLRAKIIQYLKNEVEVYNQYLNGEVYGFAVKQGDQELESCWGFYSIDEAISESKNFC